MDSFKIRDNIVSYLVIQAIKINRKIYYGIFRETKLCCCFFGLLCIISSLLRSEIFKVICRGLVYWEELEPSIEDNLCLGACNFFTISGQISSYVSIAIVI